MCNYLTDTQHVSRLLGYSLPVWREGSTHTKHQQEVRPELLSDVLEMVAIGHLGNQGNLCILYLGAMHAYQEMMVMFAGKGISFY